MSALLCAVVISCLGERNWLPSSMSTPAECNFPNEHRRCHGDCLSYSSPLGDRRRRVYRKLCC